MKLLTIAGFEDKTRCSKRSACSQKQFVEKCASHCANFISG